MEWEECYGLSRNGRKMGGVKWFRQGWKWELEYNGSSRNGRGVMVQAGMGEK